MKVTTYYHAKNVIFLPPIEWTIIESNISKQERFKNLYSKFGYPTLKLNGGQYFYLPVLIDGIEYKVVSGKRPVKETRKEK